MPHPSVVIVSPALADANNGNWRTASRWKRLLGDIAQARIAAAWPDSAPRADVLLALHARRSAPSIRAWAEVNGSRGLAVVLTGTDLYGDIATDADAARSLDLASRIVVLQSAAPRALPEPHRMKTVVIYQSTPPLSPLEKPRTRVRAVMVGHLRDVKRPDTLFDAAARLAHRADIRIDHIGGADARWEEAARETARRFPNYRWLGALPHADTRRRIQRAHVLVHASALEGGAHVIMEAACSGTPVLASQVDGNVGMLGASYEGYFPAGDAAALASLLESCRDTQGDPVGGMLARLRAQCDLRAPLFSPDAERRALLHLVADLQDPA